MLFEVVTKVTVLIRFLGRVGFYGLFAISLLCAVQWFSLWNTLPSPSGILHAIFFVASVPHILSSAFNATIVIPACHIPYLSETTFCAPFHVPRNSSGRVHWADFPGLIQVQVSSFEQLLDQSVVGSGLSLQLKKTELATADIIDLIKLHDDLQDRDLILQILQEVEAGAREASESIQYFNKYVIYTTDR